MGFNNFIKAFLPKDKVFFGLFEQVAENLIKMGQTFKSAIEEPDYNIRIQLLKSLEDGEHKNDELTHQIFVELGQNFITPFDREDIHQLAMVLDDVADFIYASAKKIIIYNVEESDDYMLQMVVLIEKCLKHLAIAVMELRNMKRLRAVTEACVAINSLENQADDLLSSSITKLFTEKKDAIEVVKLKDIYQDMEIVSDKCEDASDVIESIIIKYA